MERIKEITDILEFEIEKYNFNKEELEKLKGIEDLYNTVFPYETIDELIEEKDSVLIILDIIDKNISFALFNQLVKIETLKRKKLTKSKEYDETIAYINKLYSKLKIKKQETSSRIKELEQKIAQNKEQNKMFKSILRKVKYYQYIPYNFIQYLDKFFENNNYKEIEQIRLLELLAVYNKSIYERIHKYPLANKDEILNMLSFGFEYLGDENIDYNPEVAKKVELYYSLLEYHYQDLKEFLEQIKCEIPDENNLKLFYILILKKIQNDIFEEISLIRDKNFYIDSESKKIIIKEYKNLINLYLIFRKEYLSITVQDEKIADTGEVSLIFATNQSGKPYFLKDLKHVNNEYLEKMYQLIISLKNGTLTNKNIEGFTSLYKNFRKLKYDQIRIVIHQISPKLYCIMGVGIKKDNTGEALYSSLCSRKYPKTESEIDKALQESDDVLDSINQYVEQNKRRGNR